jgi:FkbM family methyltransferase
LSLHGLGILNFETEQVSGELDFLAGAFATPLGMEVPVVIDVGANVGEFSRAVMKLCPSAMLFAFEPHPKTFARLASAAAEAKFEAINAGCGEAAGHLTLYDYEGNTSGSQHASVYRAVLEDLHGARATSLEIEVVTIDDFLASRGFTRVRLLKIDTEGHEASVLRGAALAIQNRVFDLIQFEFNSMNVASRTFFQDLVDLLPEYKLFRLLPNGAVRLHYDALRCEIFAFQNIVAVHPEHEYPRRR